MITLHNVTKRYGTFKAIQSISLNIKAGEIHGIIGASGAGKSTLLRMMNLLEKPDEGDVIINNKKLNHLKGKEIRHIRQFLGMIFQGYHLVGNKTVFDNVAVALEIAKITKKDRTERVMESLRFVGLETHKDQYPSQLSGGQKQRVAIARAIVNNPKVLLCDEPTSALDSKTTTEILEVLKQINQQFNVTIVIVSHELEVIRSLAERVTVMADGQIYDVVDIEPTGVNKIEKGAAAFVEQLKSGGDTNLS
ncbi:methionine ABC transporter ATP-binding protein [Oceanobacillus alkalisoli]|uniref:methionine ABC transporter ATP-binding protein n=1 Tax=Oceanobacillus alkalisoli TaxID=2925113 RepID=UPI001EEFF041|nr:ATP-binding cassette domain-containing protein [Oceanobacillus alkalisoli]MCF3942651.1 ATP-binding cassette domain-containing protein [Oceanobacillus alkalisoli]MCG5102631.1 ATP-binding cassette domain-containing protein [Oceanobacillus alkalisoli]